MSKHISLIAIALLALALCWSGVQKAVAEQDDTPKQALGIIYPNPYIILGESGKKYSGIIYVKVYPVSPNLVTKYGSGPIATAELSPSQRDLCQLPLGKYEVHYAMRTGSELKTFVLRDIILRPDRPSGLIVEMNGDAKTTVIGGDVTVQQMEDSIRQLQKEVADLKEEVSRLKK